MLRGLYAPSDLRSRDVDPCISPGKKLEIIERSPITVEHRRTADDKVLDDFWGITLPFIQGVELTTCLEKSLFTDYFNVGDKALYDHGIGKRLLRSAIRYGIERNPRIEVFTTGWARLGLVNTAMSVLGEENVAVENLGNRYGWGSNRALEEIFDDDPYTEGERYLVFRIEGKIDPLEAMTWERPAPATS